MRSIILFLILVVSPLQADEAAVRKVLETQAADWNRGDIEAFMRGYHNSPETTFIGDRVLKGYSSVLARYRHQYPNRTAMGQLRYSELAIRMLGADHAVATGRFSLYRMDEAGGSAAGLFTVVFRSTPGGWKIILNHTCRQQF